ncbi:hypothetical protein N0V84_006974 [Fusarium piperis]|uniref:Transcription factor domain-containing protein n=1 Tax=Fusarium piperis TaxID=1435070 RepID=A0A9W8WAV3_9HYPO|nr:hypothetical protein N0V84_006974 [Fusarium piperis]
MLSPPPAAPVSEQAYHVSAEERRGSFHAVLSYVNDLEARVKWLESIIQEHAPGVDLNAGPGRSLSSDVGTSLRDSQPTQQNHQVEDTQSPGKITDQIGLISITTGTDLRFLGPSSGLFFTKFVLAGLGKRLHVDKDSSSDTAADSMAIPSGLLVPQPKELPSDQRHARWLSQTYFNTVHLQFPFLHEPSHWETMDKIYAEADVGAAAEFQVFMVLAIGASILSRRTRVMLSPEGYYASAMKLVAGAIKTSSYPSDMDDDHLKSENPKPRQDDEPLTNMTSAIHLFKLARFNNEIKCVLYCVDRQHPPYLRSVIVDTEAWKTDILNRLRQWRRDVPRHKETSSRHYINLLCEIKYHELVMLILRPNPLFHDPDKAAIRECFSSAMACSELYHKLYMTNMLHFGWISVHSLFLCVMVMFYCVWTPRGIADEANFDSLMRALKVSSDVLSAMGEYWPEAKKSRDVLDRVSTATIRRFTQNLNVARNNPMPPNSETPIVVPPLSNTVDWNNIDVSSSNFSSLQFEDINLDDVPFGLGYESFNESFTSANILSQFFNSGTDAMMGEAYDFEHGRDRDVGEAFDESLQDFGHSN